MNQRPSSISSGLIFGSACRDVQEGLDELGLARRAPEVPMEKAQIAAQAEFLAHLAAGARLEVLAGIQVAAD